MNKKVYWLGLTLGIFSGFLGGVLSNYLFIVEPVFAQKKDQQKMSVVEAQAFRLVDNNKKLHADLVLDNGEPVLSLYDKNGKSRSQISLTKGIPFITLSGNDDKSSAILSSNALFILDEDGGVGVENITRPNITLLGDGDSEIHIGISNGEPSLVLQDKKGMGRAAIFTSDGEPHIGLRDKDGKTRAAFYTVNGEPSLVLGSVTK